MGQEDFTTWTENDGRLSQTAPRSTWTGLLRTDDDVWLYTTKTGQLQNFTYYFKLRLTSIDSSTSTIRVNPFAVLEAVDDYADLRGAGKNQFGLQIRSSSSSTKFYWYVFECVGATNYFNGTGQNYDKGTDYYFKIVKSGTAFTIYAYSDAGYSSLIESKGLTLHANYNYPYLAVPQGIHMNTAVGTSGYVENLTDVLVTDDSEDLQAEFEVRHDGSGDLKAVFEAAGSDSADLEGVFSVRHSSSVTLKSIFEVTHFAQLNAETIIRKSASNNLAAECFVTVAASLGLPAEFRVGQGSLNLYAKFESQGIDDLYAKFESQAIEALKGFLVVRKFDSASLKCVVVIRHSAARDLKVEFIPLDFGIERLKAVFIVRQAASNNLLAYIRCLHCRGLKAVFTVRHSTFVRRRIYTKFKVRHTPAPIELTAEFIVTRKDAENFKAIFVMSTINATSELKALLYVRPKYLVADSSRIDGRMRKSRVRGGAIAPVIAKTSTTRIRGSN